MQIKKTKFHPLAVAVKVVLRALKLTIMSVLVILGLKCTLAASRAAPW